MLGLLVGAAQRALVTLVTRVGLDVQLDAGPGQRRLDHPGQGRFLAGRAADVVQGHAVGVAGLAQQLLGPVDVALGVDRRVVVEAHVAGHGGTSTVEAASPAKRPPSTSCTASLLRARLTALRTRTSAVGPASSWSDR